MLINTESNFDLSKFSNDNGLIKYDGKNIFSIILDTRKDCTYENYELTLTKLPDIYVKFTDVLTEYLAKNYKGFVLSFNKFKIGSLDMSVVIIDFEIKENEQSYHVKKYRVIYKPGYNYLLIYDDMSFININVVKYLHEEFGLLQQNFKSYVHFYLYSCRYGLTDVIRYLHRGIGLSLEDFLCNDYSGIKLAFRNGNIDVIKYLHKEVGLTLKDFESYNNYICKVTCNSGYDEVAKYLHKEIGLDNEELINYLAKNSLEFEITNIIKENNTMTISTNDLVHKYPCLKNHKENIKSFDVQLNLPYDRLIFCINGSKITCEILLSSDQINNIKRYFPCVDNNLILNFENNTKVMINKFMNKLIDHENIQMIIRFYDNEYKMLKLFN